MEPTASCSKYDNVFADRDNLPTHESGGARQSLTGFFYQFQLIMVWILEAVKSSIKFYISTEDEKLGKFDDFGFYKIVNDTEEIRTFIQLKSKQQDDYKLQFKDFFGKQINLVKYFESFFSHILKNDPEAESKNTKLILYTNCGLEFDSEYKNLLLKEEMFEKVQYDELFSADLLKFRSNFDGRDDFINIFLTNSQYNKSNVDNFLSKFYIVLNGDNILDLENKIKKHLEMFVSKNNVDKCYYQYYSNFLDWYKSKKGTKIDSDSILRYFHAMKDKITYKLHFNLMAPNVNFYGRSNELSDIENNLNSNEKSQLIDIAITGTAGVGKSELVRKCVSNLNDQFQHILWLNAEDKDTLNSSFVELAKYLGISVNERGNIHSVIRNVYDYLRDRKCLLVFDNAELYLATDFSDYLSTINKNHKVILTSQKQDWQCSLEIKIDTFLENDAVQFLSNNLSCEVKNIKLLQQIALLLSYLPLALQLAIAYIENMIKRKKLLSNNYTLEDFYLELNNSKDNFLSFKFSDIKTFDMYKKSIYMSWQLALNSLSSEVNGDKALQILQIMSFLQADNITFEIFLKLCNEDILTDSIYLLKSYSLIKCESNTCSIHRLLQNVIRIQLAENTNNNDILNNAIDCIFPMFTNINPIEYVKHIVNIWYHIKDNEQLRDKCLDYDIKYNWSYFLKWTFNIIENHNVCYEIIKYKLLYIKQNSTQEQAILRKYHALDILCSITLCLRNFNDFITLYKNYVNIEDINYPLNWNSFLHVINCFSYFYYQNKEYYNSIALYDRLILRSHSITDINTKLYIYEMKINALMWQHKYEEALSTFRDVNPTTYLLENEGIIIKKYAYFEFYYRELQITYLNLIYVIEGPDKCIKKLVMLLNSCNSQNFILRFNILQWIAKCHFIQGNLKCAIDSFTTLFSFLLDSSYKPHESDMLTLFKLVDMISLDLEASYKPGSLTSLCEKIECFLSYCRQYKDQFYEIKLKITLVNLFIKNGDFTKTIQHSKEISLKYENPSNIDIERVYYRSACSYIAMAYHLQGDTEKALLMIEKWINEENINSDHTFVCSLIDTKTYILLLDNTDKSISYIQSMIVFMKNKYPTEHNVLIELQVKIIIIIISQGKYEQALKELLNLYEYVNKKSGVFKHICEHILDILELKYKNTEKFFEFFEKHILENYLNSFYKHRFETNILKRDRNYVVTMIKKIAIQTDKIKGNSNSIFSLNLRAVVREPFKGDSSYLCENLTLAYLHYVLDDFKSALDIINDMKQSKLLFLENAPINNIQDFYRFEKLVHFRMNKNMK